MIGKLRRRGDRGSFSLELALLAPVIMALLWMMISAGRVVQSTSRVEGAARDGARAASINHAGEPVAAANEAVANSLSNNGVTCTNGAQVDVTGDFQPGGLVTVKVSCDVAVLFGSGHVRVTRSGVSVLDTFRGVN